MVTFNIAIAVFATIAGLANLLVGLESSNYSFVDMWLAVTQVVLALLMGVTGLCKREWFFKGQGVVLSHAHVYISTVFYIFVIAVIVLMA